MLDKDEIPCETISSYEKDKAGTQLFKDFIDKVKADGSGWVDYVWDHPTKGEQTPKTSYVIGIGENQLIGAGVYK